MKPIQKESFLSGFVKKDVGIKTLFFTAVLVLLSQESFAQTRHAARSSGARRQDVSARQSRQQSVSPQSERKQYPPGYFFSKKIKVKVNYDEGKIRYRYRNKTLEDPQAAGLTYSFPASSMTMQYSHDAGMLVTLNMGFEPFLVDISTKYSMNTCSFDMILKHELTHVALHRSVMERYVKVVAAAIKVRYLEEWEKGKKLSEVMKSLEETFNAAMERYKEDSEQQNKLLDGKDHYSYQWKQCNG